MRAPSSLLAGLAVIFVGACAFDSSGLAPLGPGDDAGPGADASPDAGCADECALGGGPQCADDRRAIEVCATGAAGCTVWVTDTPCGLDEQCVDATLDGPAHCGPCAICVEGEATCPADATTIREVCVSAGGCTSWQEVDCGAGALCEVPDVGAPAVCESCVECTALDPTCAGSGLAVERCELEPATGCRAWASYDCPAGWACAPGMLAEECSLQGAAGVAAPGTTGYPTTTFGNTATGSGPVLGSYLVGDRYTTAVPLTALEYKTYGTDGGSVRISLYDHDATNDLPGSRLFGEVTANVAQNAWTTIALPSGAYLPAGTYWIVFNASADDGVTYSTQTGGSRVWRPMSYSSSLPPSGGSGWTRSTAMDCTHLVGVAVRGYAKATRITLPEATAEADSLSLYAHEAGDVRLALYDDAGGPASRLWESGATPAAAAAWTTVPVSAGTPSSLTLGAGTYWLVWQWDAGTAGPGYAPGAAGDGHWIALPYGPFPATWSGGTSTAETWSLHLSYTAHAPPIGW